MSNASSSAFEHLIQDALIKGDSCDQIVADFLPRWRQNILQESEQFALAQFLLNSGQLTKLIEVCHLLLQNEMKLPWAQLLEALTRKVQLQTHEVSAIIEGTQAQSAWAQILRSYRGDLLDSRFKQKRQEQDQLRSAQLHKLKHVLIDQLNVARVQGLEEQARALANRMRATFPIDAEVAKQIRAVEEPWNLDHPDVKSRARQNFLDFKKQVSALSSDEADALEQLRAGVRIQLASFAATYAENEIDKASAARLQRQMCFDFAIMFAFLGQYADAIRLYDEAMNDEPLHEQIARLESRIWFRLHWMLESERLIELIGLLIEIEDASADRKPENIFSAVYLKSVAFWRLGRKQLAMDLLEELLQAQPDFRDAEFLLDQWREESR